MNKAFVQYRKNLYKYVTRDLNHWMWQSKSNLFNKEEKEAAKKVVEAIENLKKQMNSYIKKELT